ncbi:MAG TPA: carbohydrate ABC transporter permease [Thermotogota bacterium]|nr:carbohydrate ABC transporter permease [Thermotogota bacterium]HRW92576.1 carbohydrate ABC transporter permease [Thermotogota bacterium]
MKTKKRKQSIFIDILIWAFLVVAAVMILAPILFMFTASMMPAREILKMPYRWIPSGFEAENFWIPIKGLNNDFIFLRNILNSFIVSGAVALTTVLLSALTGYALAKFRFRGKNIVFFSIMATMMIPFEAIMVPLYLVITNFHLQNSYAGLILPFLVNAFGIFLMRQYLVPFPDEIIDAARIDGAGEFQIFRRIILPNSLPAVATLAILAFRTQWDNLLWPLLVVQSEEMKTIPLYITKFTGEMSSNEGAMMAVAVIASIPMLVLFFAMSRYFLSGAAVYSSRKG